MKFIKLFLIFFLAESVMAASKIPTVGYFPKSFPRDPIETNIYLEHLLLGQILQPLVEVGQDGSIQAGVADNWTVKNNGLIIEFSISNDARFSNGKKVTSEDVVFTLERHMKSATSQAKSYLANIKSLTAINESTVQIHLNRPYPAIFKALSRDQLGILPKNWQFDPNSKEPIVGSGAYRAVKEKDGHWYLIKNEFALQNSDIDIPKWRVLISSGDITADILKEFPDFIPVLLSNQINEIEKIVKLSSLRKIKAVQFSQSLGWWYPDSSSAEDADRRQLAMLIYRDIANYVIAKNNLRSGTGVFPSGIPGYIENTPDISTAKKLAVKNRKFKFLAIGVDAALIRGSSQIIEIAKKYNAEIEIVEIPITQLKDIPKLKPDMLIITYFGGFQDPEGFLTVITSFLNSDLKTVFGEKLYELYIQASQEQDWVKRTDIYKELNKELVLNFRVHPGWRWEGYRYCSELLAPNNQDLSYTTKLKDIKLNKEDL
jgi:ABC-type transport system substrate-binding protein